jgi:uracil-DNA glycosylase
VTSLKAIHQAILEDPGNRAATADGIPPLYSVSEHSKLAIIGQASGKLAQHSGIPWHDATA